MNVCVLDETTNEIDVTTTVWAIARMLFSPRNIDVNISVHVVAVIPFNVYDDQRTVGLYEFHNDTHFVCIVPTDDWRMTLAHEMYHVFQHVHGLNNDDNEYMAEMFGRLIADEHAHMM